MENFEIYKKVWALGKPEIGEIFSDDEDEIVMQSKYDGANMRIKMVKGVPTYGSRRCTLADAKYGKNFNRCVEYLKVKLECDYTGELDNVILVGECITGDTIIQKSSGGTLSSRVTIKDMYNFQENGKEVVKGYYTRKDGTKIQMKGKSCWWKKDKYPCLYSLDVDKDIIKTNRIKTILSLGKKDVYEIITRKGFKIKTADTHKFWSPIGWKQLKDLKINDCVGIVRFDVNITNKRLLGNQNKSYKEISSKLKKENNCFKCDNKTSLEVHHIDQNHLNNEIDNLMVLCSDCHKKEPNVKKQRGKAKEYEFDSIKSIKYVGREECYDFSMEGTENEASYVGNNFILHNCMVKHTLAYDWEKIPPFLGYDVYSIETDSYLPYEEVKTIYDALGIEMVPLIKICKAKDIVEFTDNDVPISKYAPTLAPNQKDEGVVFKNYKKQMFGKYVRSQFKEDNKKSFGSSAKFAKNDDEKISAIYGTNARIEKTIMKLRDEGLPLDLSMMSKLPTLVWKDIWEENWQDIIYEKWSITLFGAKKLVSKRCFTVLNDVVTNEALQRK